MDYFNLLKKFNINPNFWCSYEYFKFAGWKEIRNGDVFQVIDSSSGENMLPPISYNYGVIPASIYWAGFSSMSPGDKFLDHEFIYSPIKDFNSIPGGDWRTTRKNINKVVREIGHMELKNIPDNASDDIADVMEEWTGDDEMIIHDGDVMTSFLLMGENRLGLYCKDKFLGVLVFDFNWKYINFRFCVVRTFPGLSDYARILFRTMGYNRFPGMLINDGGNLDSPSLYKYKQRLCPLEINQIWSTL